MKADPLRGPLHDMIVDLRLLLAKALEAPLRDQELEPGARPILLVAVDREDP